MAFPALLPGERKAMSTALKRVGPMAGQGPGRVVARPAAAAKPRVPSHWQLFRQALGGVLGGLRRVNAGPVMLRNSYCYLGEGRAVALTRRGDMIYLDTRDLGLTPHIALHGIWEPDVEAVLDRLLKPRMRVVEVGANMGFHTLTMARAIGPGGVVHAFEANPHAMALLEQTVAVNGLAEIVSLHACAALDREGEVEFAADPRHIGSGHWAVHQGASNYSQRFTVPAVTLDARLLDRLGRIDLLRMDAEGSEPQVLRGAEGLIAASPDLTIVTEWSPPMMTVRADLSGLVTWLERSGFRFWRINAADGRLDPLPGRHLTALAHCELVISRLALE